MKITLTLDVRGTLESINATQKTADKKLSGIEAIRYAIERSGTVLDQEGFLALTNPFIEDSKFLLSNVKPSYVIGGHGIIVKPYSEEDETIQIQFNPSNSNAQRFNLAAAKHVDLILIEPIQYARTDKDGMLYYPSNRITEGDDQGGFFMDRVKIGEPNSHVNIISWARLIPRLTEIGIDEEREIVRSHQPNVVLY